MKTLAPFLGVVLLIAACGGGSGGDDTTTTSGSPQTTVTTTDPGGPGSTTPPDPSTPPPDAVVLSIDIVGGCFMMGPNCVRYEIHGDGHLDVFRLGGDTVEKVGEGSVEPIQVTDLWAEVRETDMDALRASLGPGTCQACVDGTDTMLTITVDGVTHTFDSVEVEFDETLPVFAIVAQILREADGQVEFPIVQR